MIRELKIADYITLGNLISGLLSIYFSFYGEFMIASLFILLGVAFDYLDGIVARKLNQESKLGAQLDSFADSITFGVAIAVMLFMRFQNIYFGMLLILFATSGVLRLARYNVTSEKRKGPTKYFEGTPITLNGFVFPILILFNANFYMILISVIVLTVTMISKLKIKHL